MSSAGRYLAQVPSKNFIATSWTGGFLKAPSGSSVDGDYGALDTYFGNATTVLDNAYLFSSDEALQSALGRAFDSQYADAGPGTLLRDMGKEIRVGVIGQEPRLTFRLMQYITFGPLANWWTSGGPGPGSLSVYFLTEVRDQAQTNTGAAISYWDASYGFPASSPFNTNFWNVGVTRV